MTDYTWSTEGSRARLTPVQGSTIGTLKVEVTDPRYEVAYVQFNEVAIDENGSVVRRTGPYPPDITRRVGWYEKDVVLDAGLRTRVELLLSGENGQLILDPPPAEIFGVRTASVGGGATLQVQDEDSPAAEASKLVFEGSVVSVAQGVATFKLDGRYARLSGGAMPGRLVISRNTSDPNHDSGHAEWITTDGSAVAVGFTRSGYGAVTLRHSEANRLDLYNQTYGWAQYRGGSFWATDNAFYGSDGASLSINNGAASFMTSGRGALQGRFQSLLLSDSYADASRVPLLGLWAKGHLVTLGTVYATAVVTNTQGSDATGGLSLYPSGDNYAIAFRGQASGSAWGGHGYVSGDWATYFTMNNAGNSRGWIFRAVNTSSGGVVGNVASISAAGNAYFNGVLNAAEGIIGGSLELGRTPNGGALRNTSGPLYLQGGAGVVAVAGEALAFSVANGDSHVRVHPGRHFIVEGGNSTHGSAVLSNQQVWAPGGEYYPTISGTGENNRGLVMLARPHVPFMPGYGARVRHANGYGPSAVWDSGVCSDFSGYEVRQDDAIRLHIGSDGHIENYLGHHLAPVVLSPSGPSGGAAHGTLWIII